MESDCEVHELQSVLEQMETRLLRKQEKKRAVKPLPPSPTSPGVPSTCKGASKEEALSKYKRKNRFS